MRIKLPQPPSREQLSSVGRYVVRFVDWRFVLALAVLILCASAALSSYATSQDNHALIAADAHDERIAADERAEAARGRAELLKGQRDVQAKLDALVAYFSQRGVYIPPNLLDADTSNDHDTDDGSSSSNASNEEAGGQSLSKSESPAAAPPAPTRDGKPDRPDQASEPIGAADRDHGKADKPDRGSGSARSDKRDK